MNCDKPPTQSDERPQWFSSRDGEQRGPVTSSQLKAMASDGRLKPSDYVWKEGMKEWVQARTTALVFPAAPDETVVVVHSRAPGIEAIDPSSLNFGNEQVTNAGRRSASHVYRQKSSRDGSSTHELMSTLARPAALILVCAAIAFFRPDAGDDDTGVQPDDTARVSRPMESATVAYKSGWTSGHEEGARRVTELQDMAEHTFPKENAKYKKQQVAELLRGLVERKKEERDDFIARARHAAQLGVSPPDEAIDYYTGLVDGFKKAVAPWLD